MEEKAQKKSYLEAAKTPSSSPMNSPSNVYKNKMRIGVVDIRLKWYINDYNPDEICSTCKKGIEAVEWNSYYKLSVVRYIDYNDEYKLKVLDDKDICDNEIYCDMCKDKIINKFKEEKKLVTDNNKVYNGLLSTPMIRSLPTPLLSSLTDGKGINEIPSLTL